ncbi:uncharacterized protein LOC126703841 [Quercus robur]|uniref:uncharacterized protein LOC126703841 n=1 Tax=Quercus robur TaxID=38942 RepID=UPI002163F47C|nr:uncharacterized protein LOC126703841 [Quercus robur]
MFEPQLGKNIEVYIDDMVVKSKAEVEHVNDLESIFEVLRKHKLRLNASKCSFGVSSGKFLGYMVTHHGIEVNHGQIKVINGLQPPRNPKEVEKMIGMTATLNRFISRSADRLSLVLVRVENGVQQPVYYGFGVGLVIVSSNRITIEKSLRLGFLARNNKAEYEALLIGIAMVQNMGGKVIEVFSNSRLIVGQVKGELEGRDLRMQGYLNQRGFGVGLVIVSPN